MSAAKCETGWGEGPSPQTVPRLKDHPTPPLRVDPPPPGEDKKARQRSLRSNSDSNFKQPKTHFRALAARKARVVQGIALAQTEGAGNAGRLVRPQPRV